MTMTGPCVTRRGRGRGPAPSLVVLALLGLAGQATACDERRCPDPVPDWENQRLTLEDMSRLLAATPDAERLARKGVFCKPVPVGVDARNGLPLVLMMGCDDLCPDYTQFYLVYDGYYGEDDCRQIGACVRIGGATTMPMQCLPIGHGYCRCYSEYFCGLDGQCDRSEGENALDCPQDCDCYWPGLADATHDVLVTDLSFPRDATAAEALGLDLQGDGVVDNGLQRILTFYRENLGVDTAAEYNDLLARGERVLFGRLWADSLDNDNEAVLILDDVTLNNPPPRYDGTDEVRIGYLRDDFSGCGRVLNGRFVGSKGGLGIPLPILGYSGLVYPTEIYDLNGEVGPDGWRDLRVAGTISLEMWGSAAETLADELNARIAADPTGPVAQAVALHIDGRCDDPACTGVTPGEGECTQDDPPFLTAVELQCNLGLQQAYAPDVDTDGDGQPDAISFGIRIDEAVPALGVTP